MAGEAPFPPHYLEAKRSIDDRAIDLRVWQEAMSRASALAGKAEGPFGVLEVGAGTGAMIDRLLTTLQRQIASVRYAALEPDPANAERLRGRFSERSIEVIDLPLFSYAEQAARRGERWHLIVACAVLDLLPLERAATVMAQLLVPGGLIYLPICFDGVTAFEPELDPDLDREIERLYHETMEQRRFPAEGPSEAEGTGGAYCGRRLFGKLRAAGLEILAAGGSDWVVFADRDGRYPEQEGRFLHRLIDTVETAVGPRIGDRPRLERWVEQRRLQIERGDLVYIAHQLDLLATKA